MSILSSLFHHEIHDKPNDVHNVPSSDKNISDTTPKDSSKTVGGYAANLAKEMAESGARPAMFYSEDEVKRSKTGGIIQSDHTVASKLEYKEETPRG